MGGKVKLRIKLFSVAAILISFGLYQSIAPQVNAQVLFKTSADRPSPGNPDQTTEDNGNETLYIVAGVALAAIVGYAIYKKFNKSDEDDSTSSSNASLNHLLQNERKSFVNRVQEVKENIPVDLYFGVKNHSATIPDRTYSIGFSVKF